jgi:uncharacterized LabA/DUF88 family protein
MIRRRRVDLVWEPRDRVAIFIDYPNTLLSLRELGVELDLPVLREYLTAGRFLVDAFVYVGTRPDHVDRDMAQQESLKRAGFFVRTKVGRPRANGGVKCDMDLELCLDVVTLANRSPLDVVVLASGDGDFVCLVQHLRMQGIRVEVASVSHAVASDLLAVASGFVDLEVAFAVLGGRTEATNGAGIYRNGIEITRRDEED